MANSVSARKRIRQNEARNEMNKARKSAFRTEVRRLLTLAAKGSIVEANAALGKAMSSIDKAAKKRSIHPNAASRYKSRLHRAITRAKKAGAAK